MHDIGKQLTGTPACKLHEDDRNTHQSQNNLQIHQQASFTRMTVNTPQRHQRHPQQYLTKAGKTIKENKLNQKLTTIQSHFDDRKHQATEKAREPGVPLQKKIRLSNILVSVKQGIYIFLGYPSNPRVLSPILFLPYIAHLACILIKKTLNFFPPCFMLILLKKLYFFLPCSMLILL